MVFKMKNIPETTNIMGVKKFPDSKEAKINLSPPGIMDRMGGMMNGDKGKLIIIAKKERFMPVKISFFCKSLVFWT
jgi:hypothetical protein